MLTTTEVGPVAFGFPTVAEEGALAVGFFLIVVGVDSTTAGTSTGAAVVTGAIVVGAAVVGATVVGAAVVGGTVVGGAVVGGAAVVGATVVGAKVGVGNSGFSWALTPEAESPTANTPLRMVAEILRSRRVYELEKVCTLIDYRSLMYLRQCHRPHFLGRIFKTERAAWC